MRMRKTILSIGTALAVMFLAASLHSVEIKKSTASVSAGYGDELMISVRVTGGNGSVLKPGERVKLTFQTNRDAYVVLYNIDSDGFVTLLYPGDGKPARIKGHKVYFLPEAGTGFNWIVEGKTGIEYIHAVATDDPTAIREEELYFLAQNGNQPEDKRFRIDGDPFLSFNMIDEEIIGNARDYPPATDYTYFYINRKVDYPRYLCSKCHAPGKLTDPYNMDCSEIIVERFAYEEDISYPYPPLFDITYADEAGDDYYSSSKYIDEHFDYDYEEDEDRPIYLSIYYSDNYYPYRYYWPSYRTFWTRYYYDPFWWDFYWYWDFGFSFYFTDYYYHYWPFYSWYYPYNWYWMYDYHNNYYRYYDCCYPDYRPLYADRSITKRTLNYAATSTDLMRDRTIANSRLASSGSRTYSRRASDPEAATSRSAGAASRLANRADSRTLMRRSDYRSDRTASPERRSVSRRIVHGSEGSRGTVERSRNRSATEKSSNVRKDRTRSSGSSSDSRSRSDSRKVERSTKSRSQSAKQSDRSNTKSSTVDRRRTRSSSRKSDAVKKSAPKRQSSTPSRSRSARSSTVNRSTSPARSSSSSSSGGSSRSSRSGNSRRK
jgi:hypothetical protein